MPVSITSRILLRFVIDRCWLCPTYTDQLVRHVSAPLSTTVKALLPSITNKHRQSIIELNLGACSSASLRFDLLVDFHPH